MRHPGRSIVTAAAAGLVLVCAPWAQADDAGLVATERAGALLGPQGWSALIGNMPAHTTLGLRSGAPGRPHSVRLLGDYYVDGALPGAEAASGFRATGGIVLPTSWTADPVVGGMEDGVHRASPYAFQRWPGSTYLGLGYTRAWQGGLRFNADLGLTRPFGSLSNLGAGGYWLDDDALRNLRSSTSLELGMNYSF